MDFIKTLINKYHHKKIIRDYLKAFPPYEIHPSIGIDLRANQMAKTAKKDITIYAKDSRLAGPSDGQPYDTQKMISHYKKIGRTLTEEEAAKFRIEQNHPQN